MSGINLQSIVVAFVGAMMLVFRLRLFSGRRHERSGRTFRQQKPSRLEKREDDEAVLQPAGFQKEYP